MKRYCETCDELIADGAVVVVEAVAVYHELPSKKTYAIDKPTQCLSMRHSECAAPKGA